MKTSRRPPRKKGSRKSSGSGASGSATLLLNDDWMQFLHALVSTGSRFVLVGGHAIAVHAEPRFTEDLDVFIEPTLENARRVRQALVDFGFGAIAPEPEALAAPDRVWMLGRKPRRIDILTGISGVTFAEAVRRRLEVTIAGKAIPVIGRSALVKNKLASNRTKDLLDIELLKKHGPRRSRSR